MSVGQTKSQFIVWGPVFGVGLGAAFGTVFDAVALGVAFSATFGAVFSLASGLLQSQLRKPESDSEETVGWSRAARPADTQHAE